MVTDGDYMYHGEDQVMYRTVKYVIHMKKDANENYRVNQILQDSKINDRILVLTKQIP